MSVRVRDASPPMWSPASGAATHERRPMGIAAAAQTPTMWRRESWGMTTVRALSAVAERVRPAG